MPIEDYNPYPKMGYIEKKEVIPSMVNVDPNNFNKKISDLQEVIYKLQKEIDEMYTLNEMAKCFEVGEGNYIIFEDYMTILWKNKKLK